MDETAKNANLILLTVVSDIGARMRFGFKKRQEMVDAISRGEEPTGYRTDWLRETVAAVFQTLGVAAAYFNVMHPQDRISTADFFDVLATATQKLRDQLDKS